MRNSTRKKKQIHDFELNFLYRFKIGTKIFNYFNLNDTNYENL